MSDVRAAIRSGLYALIDDTPRDACGIGGIASSGRVPNREVVERTLQALIQLDHRGACCGQVGDGAGLHCSLPLDFFRRRAHGLRDGDSLAVGQFFFPQGTDRPHWHHVLETIVRDAGGIPLNWRDVPTNPIALPEVVHQASPHIEQFFVALPEGSDEAWCVHVRRAWDAALRAKATVVSFSSRIIVYKALATSLQFADFYPDLHHPEFCSTIAFFHRRFSTNTWPDWSLAQPFQLLGHNGEINTIRTNRNAAAASGFTLTPGVSDSRNLDEWIEHLVSDCGLGLAESLRICMPSADEEFSTSLREGGSLAIWDGPAGVIASDGDWLVGLVDRMGLRPVRWQTDDRGWLYLGSESGIFGLEAIDIRSSGQLQPGEMIAFHAASGMLLANSEVRKRCPIQPKECSPSVYLTTTAPVVESTEHGGTLDQRLQAHGWDFDRMSFLREIAKTGKEPLSSMGFDRVLTVFSQNHPTLFKYLYQTFAEVTNPPIDPYREGGAMSLETWLGKRSFATPVLTDDALRTIPFCVRLTCDYDDELEDNTGDRLAAAIESLQSNAEAEVRNGARLLLISQISLLPVAPSLLALAAVHEHLCRLNLRNRCCLVVQTLDAQESHDLCALIGFGADAVCPSMMYGIVANGIKTEETVLSAEACQANIVKAMDDGIRKVMAKMGITLIQGYRGGRYFEAIGLGPEIMRFLGNCPSRIGGIGLAELVEDARWRLRLSQKTTVIARNRDYHAYNSKVRMALRTVAAEDTASAALSAAWDDPASGSPAYAKFTSLVNSRTPTVLRDLLAIVPSENAIPLEEVEPALLMVRRLFRGAAMSHGALTRQAHETIAKAFNDLGAWSNCGEGGESRDRNDIPSQAASRFWDSIRHERQSRPDDHCLGGEVRHSRRRSRIRQIASGRFGVDAEYLVNANELQIKMAQGAKPGEGGQLMGRKVTEEIAAIRFGQPGRDLISPPPHHDIYSIEDLAQLISDLRAVNPRAVVSVKVVAVENVGTIAVGIAKAGADLIEIDGLDGGTGAASASSKEHCGLPSEMGLAEAHQALAIGGVRNSVRLRVGGGIKNGVDIVKYAMLGADEFSLGQSLMVSVGCIVCKNCHIPNCPTGISGSPEIFEGQPRDVGSFLVKLAEEVRRILASLGVRRIEEIVGCCDRLERVNPILPRAATLDLSRFLRPEFAKPRLKDAPLCMVPPPDALNQRILAASRPALDNGIDALFESTVTNNDRSTGAALAGEIARRFGREGFSGSLRLRFHGDAGQSFAAWCTTGLQIELLGTAQDGVAKGMSGGSVVIHLPHHHRGGIHVAGNAVAYGATGGTLYLAGSAGQRMAVRNSGATVVAEGAGKYACEYMTRGRVVLLGPVGSEIGAGMTGGELVVYAPDQILKIHTGSVFIRDCDAEYDWIKPLLEDFAYRTRSDVAYSILNNWKFVIRNRWLRLITPKV